MNNYMQERNEKGFTLIELLVAIVVVGILTAVAIVGIAGLTDKGSNAACSASIDAAQAAGAVYYANQGHYPTSFDQMTVGTPPVLTLQNGVSATGTTMKNGTKWSVTLGGGGGNTPNTFTACP